MQVIMLENILAPSMLAILNLILRAMTTFLSIRSDSLLVGSTPGAAGGRGREWRGDGQLRGKRPALGVQAKPRRDGSGRRLLLLRHGPRVYRGAAAQITPPTVLGIMIQQRQGVVQRGQLRGRLPVLPGQRSGLAQVHTQVAAKLVPRIVSRS